MQEKAMILPLLISYSQANLNSIRQEAQIVLKELSGRHFCQFHYSEPQKGHTKVRIMIPGVEWDMVVEIGKDHLCFMNPWFRKSRTLEPLREDDGIVQECDIIFIDKRISPIAQIIDMDKSSCLADVRDFILRCRRLKKPVVRLHKEKEREIWSAYCDGLNALSRERRNFITLDYVGDPILYNDSRFGEIYTMKLSIGAETLENIPAKVEGMLSNKYRISEVVFNQERTELEIKCKGTEKVLEDDLNEVTDFLHNYGFTMSDNSIVNILKMSVSCHDIKKRIDIYDKLDACLEEEGLNFSNNGSLEYQLENDIEAQRFIQIANDVFKNLGHAIMVNNIHIGLELDDDKNEAIRKDLAKLDKISLSRHKLCIFPDDEKDYNALKNEVLRSFNKHGVECTLPNYYVTCKMEGIDAKAEIRRSIMRKAEEELAEFRKISYSYSYDAEQARVMRFEFSFRAAEERENIVEQFSAAVDTLGPSYKLTIKDRLGSTIIRFTQDEKKIQEVEEELRLNYQGEEIKLVAGKVYRELFKRVTDPENIIDPILREQYNRFMNECPVIGTCHKRTPDSIIVRLSEDFYDGQEMEQSIRRGDMIYFPSVGTSTDLRRQYDAIQRINRPGKIINGRKIEPPVNPRLSSFLFDPLFAHNIYEDISQMMQNVKNNKIEEHLNEKQIEAVAKAVLAQDIAFIQGPPGTGKTTVIAEIIWQEIRRNPKCKILLTSQTNLAVDNALERLKYKRAIRPLRIMSDQRVDNEELVYNIDVLDTWVTFPNEYNKNNVVEKWIDSIVERIDEHSEYADITSEWKESLKKKDKSVRKEFVERYKSSVNLVAATCSICGSRIFYQMYEKMYESNEVAFDVVIMDEASKATPLEMAIPMVLGKKIIVIGDHKQLPPVLDENSIDTALRKIGRDDLATKIQDLKDSQFKKLFLLCQKYMPNLVTTLNIQYRMHRDIMMTVNQFYVDELGENGLKCGIENVMDIADYKTRGSRWHGISYEPFISPSTHAIWVNVNGKEEKDYTSYKNYDEIKAIKTVVSALTRAEGFYEYIHAQEKMEDKEIGLITFYSAQKKELKKLEQSGQLDKYSDYRIDVVDRFQGMERNIVIVSTVRSNHYNGIGFAREIERINVAFSRARSLLIVIGNRDLFYTKYNYRKSIDAMETVDIKQIEDLLYNEQ